MKINFLLFKTFFFPLGNNYWGDDSQLSLHPVKSPFKTKIKCLIMQYPGEPNTKHGIRHENWRCEG